LDSITVELVCHPNTPSTAVECLPVMIDRDYKILTLNFIVQGELSRIKLPALAKPYRTDGLWQTTCAELFIKREGTVYDEYNFSPSGAWAAYEFESYRSGMRSKFLDLPPTCGGHLDFEALYVTGCLPEDTQSAIVIALSAVIEETDGTKSYWALRHPPGAPDFHHPDCFALTLPAFGAA